MPVWVGLLDALGVLLALALAYGIALIVRRRVISRHGGTFELSYRMRTEHPGRGWVLGMGRYTGESLEWFRIFSLAYAGHRAPEGAEEMSLYGSHVVVTCTYEQETLEIAMSESSLTGFQAWLEAGPPGVDWDRR